MAFGICSDVAAIKCISCMNQPIWLYKSLYIDPGCCTHVLKRLV